MLLSLLRVLFTCLAKGKEIEHMWEGKLGVLVSLFWSKCPGSPAGSEMLKSQKWMIPILNLSLFWKLSRTDIHCCSNPPLCVCRWAGGRSHSPAL